MRECRECCISAAGQQSAARLPDRVASAQVNHASIQQRQPKSLLEAANASSTQAFKLSSCACLASQLLAGPSAESGPVMPGGGPRPTTRQRERSPPNRPIAPHRPCVGMEPDVPPLVIGTPFSAIAGEAMTGSTREQRPGWPFLRFVRHREPAARRAGRARQAVGRVGRPERRGPKEVFDLLFYPRVDDGRRHGCPS